MKKRVSATSPKKSAIGGALRDLDKELKLLSKQKTELKRGLMGASAAINAHRKQERLLQEKIARLIEKEAKLNQRKKNLQQKVEGVSEKIVKISKIKSEISDI